MHGDSTNVPHLAQPRAAKDRGLSIEFLAEQGLFNLEEYWASLHN